MFEEILENYGSIKDIKSIAPYGTGRINKTFLIDANGKYILQRVNSDIFKDVEGLMKNVEFVTDHIRGKIEEEHSDRKTLNLVKTNDSSSFVKSPDGYYRISEFIENGTYVDKTNDLKLLKEAGRAYGQFQYDLRDFDANKLAITIPDFHNTLSRFYNFGNAVESATDLKRLEKADDLIQEAMDKSKYANAIVMQVENGSLPKRVVHNDTKLNNVVFNEGLDKAIAVLDLDTVMPDTLLYDYGDAIRSACNNASEEEKDTEKVTFNLDKYKAFTEGYLDVMKDELTPDEKVLMPLSPLVMSYELGLRFLTDYLEGDKYFGVKGEDDNLDRAKVQFSLLNSMEKSLDKMTEFYDDCLSLENEKTM